MDLRYHRPARLDDALLVCSRLMRVRAASVDIHQRVMCGADMVAQAEVEAAFVAPSGRPRRQPAEWLACFAPLIWKGE